MASFQDRAQHAVAQLDKEVRCFLCDSVCFVLAAQTGGSSVHITSVYSVKSSKRTITVCSHLSALERHSTVGFHKFETMTDFQNYLISHKWNDRLKSYTQAIKKDD